MIRPQFIAGSEVVKKCYWFLFFAIGGGGLEPESITHSYAIGPNERGRKASTTRTTSSLDSGGFADNRRSHPCLLRTRRSGVFSSISKINLFVY